MNENKDSESKRRVIFKLYRRIWLERKGRKVMKSWRDRKEGKNWNSRESLEEKEWIKYRRWRWYRERRKENISKDWIKEGKEEWREGIKWKNKNRRRNNEGKRK